jgi:hypothetical protein
LAGDQARSDIGGAGEQPNNIIGEYDCAYGYPIAANGEAYCPPYGYYASGTSILASATG